jgi:hypothetical protein
MVQARVISSMVSIISKVKVKMKAIPITGLGGL